MFISKEVLGYVDYYKDSDISRDEFLSNFEEDDDRKYMKQTIMNMEKIGYFEKCNIKKSERGMEALDTVYFMLTQKCNLKCKHCSTSCSPEVEDALDLEQAKIIIDNINKIGVKSIIFSGGEPMIYSYFYDIITYAKKVLTGVEFILSTNGTLVREDNVRFLVDNFDAIEMSLDGIDEISCNRIRGKGVFGKVIDSVKLLQESGFYNIGLSTVTGSKQNDYIKAFNLLNEKLKTRSVVRFLDPVGRATENISKFYSEKTNLPISIADIYLDTSLESRKVSSCSCIAYESVIYIDYHGNVYPCPTLYKDEYCIMNINDKKFSKELLFEKILLRREEFQNILDFEGTICEYCDINIFCWNCPEHFLRAKEAGEISIWCEKMKNNISRIVWKQIGK
ncbi:radical SAM domain protein [Peptostreptococcus anaerobius CAG:621]|nr:radical SAM domain protein [Peptostreptococcus anaerobius CAG:621]